MADQPPIAAKPFFVAVGYNGLRMSSENGSDWKNIQIGKEGEVYRFVAFGNGRYATVGSYGGDNIMAVTEEGATWKTGKKEAKYVKYLRGLGYGKGMFLGLGGDPGSVGDSKPFVTTSTDGLNWSELTDVAGKNIIRRVAWGDDRWVGVGDRGRRSYSTDHGATWQDMPKPDATATLIDIAFGAGRFVGVGLHGLRASTEDGVTWSEPIRGEEGEHINRVIWTGDRFVAVGLGGTYFSPTGLVWTRQPNKNAPLTAAYGGGLFVGTQWKGRILVSKNAIDWTQVFKAEHHVEGLGYGG